MVMFVAFHPLPGSVKTQIKTISYTNVATPNKMTLFDVMAFSRVALAYGNDPAWPFALSGLLEGGIGPMGAALVAGGVSVPL